SPVMTRVSDETDASWRLQPVPSSFTHVRRLFVVALVSNLLGSPTACVRVPAVSRTLAAQSRPRRYFAEAGVPTDFFSLQPRVGNPRVAHFETNTAEGTVSALDRSPTRTFLLRVSSTE